jgi:hypothetical protein
LPRLRAFLGDGGDCLILNAQDGLHLGSSKSALQVVCSLADPNDQPRFDVEAVWRTIKHACDSVPGRVSAERLKASEAVLRQKSTTGIYDVFHFVGHAECRAALNYASIFLEAADGASRKLTGSYFASILSFRKAPRAVVLQACDNASFCFEPIADSLLEKGTRIVLMLPSLPADAAELVLARFHAALLDESPIRSLQEDLRSAHSSAYLLKVATHEHEPSPVVESQPESGNNIRVVPPTPLVPPPPIFSKAAASTPFVLPEAQSLKDLRRKRESGHFDVFLCHNSMDKPEVIVIAQKLRELGILPWLDVWELPPGRPWQSELERQISTIGAAAVFVGPMGMGPWQEREIHGFLDEFVSRGVPVIPVVLPNATRLPTLPYSLRGMTWVDFRLTDPDPLRRLLWGITGQRPED